MKIKITSQNIENLLITFNNQQLRYLLNRLRIFSLLNTPYSAAFVIPSENKYLFEVIQGANLQQDDKSKFDYLVILLENEILLQKNNLKNQTLEQFFAQCNPQYSQLQHIGKRARLEINDRIELININFQRYKWQLLKQEAGNSVYSYILEEQDCVTKCQINYPQVQMGTLLESPGLIDQQTFLQHLINEKQSEQKRIISNQDRLSNMLVIHLFEVRELIQQKLQRQLEIQIFPTLYNFNFVMQNTLIPHFANQTHFAQFVLQNSIIHSQDNNKTNYFLPALMQGLEITIQPFDFLEQESIYDGLVKIKFNQVRKDNTEEFTKFWKQKYLSKYHNTEQIDGIQVEIKEFSYLHSIDCNINTAVEYLEHQIDPKTLICQKCKIKIEDYGSLFFDLKFYHFYQNLKEILLSPHYSDMPGVFVCPISLRMISRSNIHEISSEIVNDHQEVLITIYNHPIQLASQDEIAEVKDDEEHLNTMMQIRERNQEWLMSDWD